MACVAMWPYQHSCCSSTYERQAHIMPPVYSTLCTSFTARYRSYLVPVACSLLPFSGTIILHTAGINSTTIY